eukprot:m.505678 g.505678  ORF g.505678 m.505678 type:complete len:179 (-) comp57366_c0_seq15:1453-1989(-)
MMGDVVFVLSGFQNPLREQIRNNAISLGASYRANWDRSCTHLICAFANTPKAREVGDKGWIVQREWLDDCIKRQKRLPEARYTFGAKASAVSDDEEDDDEDDEEDDDEDETDVDDVADVPLVRMDADSDPEYVPQAKSKTRGVPVITRIERCTRIPHHNMFPTHAVKLTWLVSMQCCF